MTVADNQHSVRGALKRLAQQVADQQAMPDDSYVSTLDEGLAALANLEEQYEVASRERNQFEARMVKALDERVEMQKERDALVEQLRAEQQFADKFQDEVAELKEQLETQATLLDEAKRLVLHPNKTRAAWHDWADEWLERLKAFTAEGSSPAKRPQ